MLFDFAAGFCPGEQPSVLVVSRLEGCCSATDLFAGGAVGGGLTGGGLLADGDEPLDEEGVALEGLLVTAVSSVVGRVLGRAREVEFGGEACVRDEEKGSESKKRKEGGTERESAGGTTESSVVDRARRKQV